MRSWSNGHGGERVGPVATFDMATKRPCITIRFPTIICRAFEWLFGTMGQHVPIEMVLTLKRLGTHGARVSPLVTVGKLVLCES